MLNVNYVKVQASKQAVRFSQCDSGESFNPPPPFFFLFITELMIIIKNILRPFVFLVITVILSKPVFAQIPAQTLPSFEFLRGDRISFTEKNIPPGKMSFFAFVDIDCEHCQKAIKNVEEQYGHFRKISIYIVSLAEPGKMNRFMTRYAPNLKGRENVLILQDKSNQFITRFKPYKYPAMFLYSIDKKLLDYEDNEASVFSFTNTIKRQ